MRKGIYFVNNLNQLILSMKPKVSRFALSTKEGRAKYDFKGNMEAVRLADIKEWKELNLLDNWAVNRKKHT